MSNFRLPRSVCAAVGRLLRGSHGTLDALFKSAGAPGDPPQLSHDSKWKEWLFRAGEDPSVDSLRVLGNVLEEAMDAAPEVSTEAYREWSEKREKVVAALEDSGLTYFRGGRVLPTGGEPDEQTPPTSDETRVGQAKPSNINELLGPIVRGLRRAMHPLANRRKGAQALSFNTEYDVQDLLHALLRPWVADIRPEEFTPSYAGSSTRMDFLLPKYGIVIELKFVRDKAHARKIGDELIVDISHYQAHPKCGELWCVVFDQDHLITNSEGLKTDLEGQHMTQSDKVIVRVFVL